jgi:PAS domain S-box-containing protein
LEETSPFTGDDFFQQLALSLARVCGVRWSFVDELLLDVTRVRIVAGSQDGLLLESWDYDLSGTPCSVVLTDGRCLVDRDVAGKFPQDLWLVEEGAQAYAGIRLETRAGDPIGLFAIVHDAPMDMEEQARLLEDLAPRVAAELERRQMDNVLRRNEARFRLLAECSKDILFYCHLQPELAFEYISPAVEATTGYRPEAFRANPGQASQMIVPEDRERALEALRTADETPLTVRAIRADGRPIWMEYRNFPIRDAQGHLIAVGGSIRDATRRIENEQAVMQSERVKQALLDAVPDTILHVDANQKLLAFMPGEASPYVRSAVADPVGANLWDTLPAFALALSRLVRTVLSTNHLQREELEHPGADGEARYLEARGVPFGHSEVLLILRDFTAAKWHEGEEERRRIRDDIDTKVESLRANPYGLTYRELAVLHLVADGAADKQIAEAMGISTYTVNKHVGNILSKMKAVSRTEAGVRAAREGLLAA